MSDFEEYNALMGTGHESKQAVKPEDEFFHSAYISGQTRKNHINIDEIVGKLQIRGVEYNLDSINMIITHVKQILTKATRSADGKEKTECFSYQEGPPPWTGTKGIQCGTNSAERAANEFCNSCRAQLIVTGVYCDAAGKPILTEEKKPIFIFIRGKGMKYSNVADYLNTLTNMEIDFIFQPETEESKKFEKSVVNNKRFVTTLTKGQANSNYGMKDVFTLTAGTKLPTEVVKKVLEMSKKTVEPFNEKFNWGAKGGAQGYAQTTQVDASNVFEPAAQTKSQPAPVVENISPSKPAASVETPAVPASSDFNLDDIKF